MDKFIPFSVRHGYINPEEILKRNYENMTEELRVRLWNTFIELLKKYSNSEYTSIKKLAIELKESLWGDFFHRHIDTTPYILNYHGIEKFKKEFFSLEWYRVYDLIEFLFKHLKKVKVSHRQYEELLLQSKINQILEEEFAPYRMIEGQITPITDEYEIQTIKKAFENADKYKPVKEHLEKALKHLSNRTNPDYVNSIKESVLALESLANLILGISGKTLTSIHQKLCSQLKCPKPIEEQIKKYYDWASREEGIRHGKTKEKSTIGQAEAKLFLVQISGLINYLISKSSQRK